VQWKDSDCSRYLDAVTSVQIYFFWRGWGRNFIWRQIDIDLHNGYGANTSRRAPIFYSPSFASTHSAFARGDGQAELTWVDGYVQRR